MRFAKPIAICGAVSALLLAGCSAMQAGAAPSQTTTSTTPPTTEPAAASVELNGEQLFNQNCAACHGEQARGTKQGPPLVHKIYEPSHHGDAAFVLAVRNGSRQHHWSFGDMPAQPHVSDEQVKAITAYVRALQRDAGIR